MSDEILRLRKALATMGGGTGRRYSAAMRLRVGTAATRMRADGVSWQAIGKEMGIPHETVRRFCSDRTECGFVPVEVARLTSTGMVLVTPNGFRVEGIVATEAVELIRQLS
jgi:hypothetical protein